MVQALPSSHAGPVTGAPTQDPDWHASPVVQGLPSSQRSPVAGVPTQPVAWQASLVVQPLPSSHVAPVSTVQIPSAVAPRATVQASQAPSAQLVLQQTPSTQTAPAHVALVAQGWPSGAGRVDVSSTLTVAQTSASVRSPNPTSKRPSGSSVAVFSWRSGASMAPKGAQVFAAGS